MQRRLRRVSAVLGPRALAVAVGSSRRRGCPKRSKGAGAGGVPTRGRTHALKVADPRRRAREAPASASMASGSAGLARWRLGDRTGSVMMWGNWESGSLWRPRKVRRRARALGGTRRAAASRAPESRGGGRTGSGGVADEGRAWARWRTAEVADGTGVVAGSRRGRVGRPRSVTWEVARALGQICEAACKQRREIRSARAEIGRRGGSSRGRVRRGSGGGGTSGATTDSSPSGSTEKPLPSDPRPRTGHGRQDRPVSGRRGGSCDRKAPAAPQSRRE